MTVELGLATVGFIHRLCQLTHLVGEGTHNNCENDLMLVASFLCHKTKTYK